MAAGAPLVLDGGTSQSGGVAINYAQNSGTLTIQNDYGNGGVLVEGNTFTFEDINKYKDDFTIGTNGNTTFENNTNSSSGFAIQNSSAVNLFTVNTSTSTITIGGTASSFGTLQLSNGHFESTQTTAPTIGTPTSCNTGGSAAAVTTGSTDSAGSFAVTTGTGTNDPNTCQVILTFNQPYGTAPKSVLITGASTGAALEGAAVTATSTTTFTVVLPNNTAPNTTYEYYYWVVQ
jgi:hypothetical protein